VFDDAADVRLSVDVVRRVATVLGEVREAERLEGKRLVVDDVPVERVELVVGHGVELFEDDGHRDEVTRRVEHETSVLEAGLVDDKCRVVDGQLASWAGVRSRFR